MENRHLQNEEGTRALLHTGFIERSGSRLPWPWTNTFHLFAKTQDKIPELAQSCDVPNNGPLHAVSLYADLAYRKLRHSTLSTIFPNCSRFSSRSCAARAFSSDITVSIAGLTDPRRTRSSTEKSSPLLPMYEPRIKMCRLKR